MSNAQKHVTHQSCKWCNQKFTARNSWQKFCGAPCRQAAYRGRTPRAKNVQSFRRFARRLLFLAERSRCQPTTIYDFETWIAQEWDEIGRLGNYELPKLPEGYVQEFQRRLGLLTQSLPKLTKDFKKLQSNIK